MNYLMIMDIDNTQYNLIIQSHGLSHPEWKLLSTVGKWPLPYSSIAEVAAGHTRHDRRGAISVDDCAVALDKCIEKGLLRVINEEHLRELQLYLAMHPAVGPVYGLPACNDVDFTPSGARLYQRVVRQLFGEMRYKYAYFIRTFVGRQTLYSQTKRGLMAGLNEIMTDRNVIKTGQVSAIQQWRVYWWKKYRNGYHVDIDFGTAATVRRKTR